MHSLSTLRCYCWESARAFHSPCMRHFNTCWKCSFIGVSPCHSHSRVLAFTEDLPFLHLKAPLLSVTLNLFTGLLARLPLSFGMTVKILGYLIHGCWSIVQSSECKSSPSQMATERVSEIRAWQGNIASTFLFLNLDQSYNQKERFPELLSIAVCSHPVQHRQGHQQWFDIGLHYQGYCNSYEF